MYGILDVMLLITHWCLDSRLVVGMAYCFTGSTCYLTPRMRRREWWRDRWLLPWINTERYAHYIWVEHIYCTKTRLVTCCTESIVRGRCVSVGNSNLLGYRNMCETHKPWLKLTKLMIFSYLEDCFLCVTTF